MSLHKGRDMDLFTDSAILGSARMELEIARRGEIPNLEDAENKYINTYANFCNKWIRNSNDAS